MASSKDIIQHSSRPLGQHRPSMSTNLGSLPRQFHSRNHSTSVSGSLIANHRVSRRKSVSSTAASNVAAMVAAARESGDISMGMPITNRRNTMSKGSRSAVGSLPSPPASLPSHRIRLTSGGKFDQSESAIDDDPIDEDMDEEEETEFKQSRMRRASDGQPLGKDRKKSSGGDLKCDKCGKGYKHSSCLTKHLWEHTPEWTLTSKLLISKHQQVQLLEAASILVNLNQDGPTPPQSAKDFSDDSASPPASNSSETQDGTSSADTTPPPQDVYNGSGSYRHKRMSSGYSGYSRSYQSAPSANSYTGSVLNGSTFSQYRQPSQERRPSSGYTHDTERDELTNAINLLSCSFGSQRSATGTPRTVIPVTMEDAPPVPHIPAQYLSNFSGTTLGASLHPRQTESYTRHQIHLDRDVKMEESEESVADDEEYDHRSRGRSDEDDDGVFGRMEE